jgi:uncharacterized membrane protein YfcA
MRAVGGNYPIPMVLSAVVGRAAGAYCAVFVRQPYFRKITSLLLRATAKLGEH